MTLVYIISMDTKLDPQPFGPHIWVTTVQAATPECKMLTQHSSAGAH